MDSIIQLGDPDRALSLLHSFGCSYICLWLHVSPQNYLHCTNGYYHEEFTEQQASSSSGTLASQLFDRYQHQTIFLVKNDRVPGLAFQQRNHFMAVGDSYLQRLAYSEIQAQFYQEARIQTAVFMGCRSGEIELGWSTVPKMNMIEMELRNLFPEEFQLPLHQLPSPLQEAQQQTRVSPTSSVSLDSPEYPSFLFNMSTMRETPLIINQPNTTVATMKTSPSHPQSHILTRQAFPSPESVDAALATALLATISSTSSALPLTSQEGSSVAAPPDQFFRRAELRAFRKYNGAHMARRSQLRRAPAAGTLQIRQNMMKKMMSFYHALNIRRLHEAQAQQLGVVSRPTSTSTSTQLHHVLNERKRREKINESFQALRSLLPPGTRKDKASVLRTTKEHINKLKDQISQLNQRNQLLESQLSSNNATKVVDTDMETLSSSSSSSNEGYVVHLIPVTESSSEERTTDLRVSMRGDGSSMLDLVIRLLEFLKGVPQVRLGSMEAQTVATSSQQQQQQQEQHHSINRVTLRLIIEGSDWDESAFMEAVRRVIADLTHWTR